MRSVVVVAFTAFAAAIAHAEDAPVAVTLADVLAATGTAPASQVWRHEIEAADALVDAASAWPDPSLRVETNRLTARLVAGAVVPLPVFGTVGAARRVAAAQARAVRSEAIVSDRDVRRRAIAAWISLARADGEIVATALAATQAAELERVAVGRLDAGVGAEVDVTTARAARARAERAAASAKRAQQAASADLAGVLGWDPMTAMVSAGDLPGSTSITFEELRARLPAHPERTLAQRKVAAADATIRQVRRQALPSLAVEAQVSAFDPTTPGTDVFVALSLALPLFARTGDRARSARATATAERARLAVTETQLAGGLVAAYRRWQAAAETLAALENDVIPAQERAAALSRQAYREGARDLVSALQADRDLSAVRAEVITARADVATAWAALQDAAGDDLGGLGAN
ncbi:MAG: transporter [Myxococcales bacterium]|nr:transporter [Myxococcales bacterium]